MSVGLLPPGFLQFLDSNGDPLTGGSVAYYDPAVPGSFKTIWADKDKTVAVQNPSPLDQAGRPTSGGATVGIWGEGLYRMEVKNAQDTLQWTAITLASGGDDSLLNKEIADRIAADDALRALINAEVTRATNAENALGARIDKEITDRTAADAHLQDEINAVNTRIDNLPTGGGGGGTVITVKTGQATSTAEGDFNTVFAQPYPNHVLNIIIDSSIAIPPALIRYQIWNNSADAISGHLEIGALGPEENGQFTWTAAQFRLFNWYATGY